VAAYTAVQLRGGPREAMKAGMSLKRPVMGGHAEMEEAADAWGRAWIQEAPFILSALTRDEIMAELETHEGDKFGTSKYPMVLYGAGWRLDPTDKQLARKPQLAEMLAGVRVQVQKQSGVKVPKAPELKTKKAQKALLPWKDSADQ